MTGTTGSKKNKSRGATKGKKIPVYISGLQGKHTMETGIAYFYRGHDLYGPMRNPLMPVSFPTKSEVLVVGLTYDCAPHYNPANPTLRDERQVCALGRSKFHEWENRSKETAPEDKSTPFEGQVAIVNNLMANSTGTIMPAQGKSGNQTAETAYSISRNPSVQVHAPETTNTHDSDRYYNDHALYLAASAPGSRPLTRFSTPFGSRSISPSVGHAASGGGLRAVASTTQISHMYGDYEQYMSSLSHHLNGEHMSYEQYMSSLETQNALLNANRLKALLEEQVRISDSRDYAGDGHVYGTGNETRVQTSQPTMRRISSMASMTTLTDAYRAPSAPRGPSDISNQSNTSHKGGYLDPLTDPRESFRLQSAPNTKQQFNTSNSPRQLSRIASVPAIDTNSGYLAGSTISRTSSRMSNATASPILNYDSPPWKNALTRPPTPYRPGHPENPEDRVDYLHLNGPGPTLPFSNPPSRLKTPEDRIGLLAYNPDLSFALPARSTSPFGAIGTGRPTTTRPRKSSMNKASKALNEAYNLGHNPTLRTYDYATLISNEPVQVTYARDGTDVFPEMHPAIKGPKYPEPSAYMAPSAVGESSNASDGPETSQVLKCPIHGEDCDGETVENPHLTEQAMRGRGFVENDYPRFEANGRVMVDWNQLLKEEQNSRTRRG